MYIYYTGYRKIYTHHKTIRRRGSHSEKNKKPSLNPFFPSPAKPSSRSQATKPSSSSTKKTSSKRQSQPPQPAKPKTKLASTQPKPKPKPNPKPKVEPEPEPVSCIICLTDYPPRETTLLPCKHRMCNACIRRAFELSMRDPQHMPPRCCSSTQAIPSKAVSHLFTPSFLARWRQRRRELAISPQKRLYCPARGCSARNGGTQVWIPPENIRPSHSAPPRRKAICPRCQERVCADCGRLWHGKQACSTGASKQDEEKEREAFAALARDKGWKRCVGCAAMVERNEGCNHMTCRCGAEFCMACGAQWKTCGCPLFPPVTLTGLPELGLGGGGLGLGEGEIGRRPAVDPILYLIDDFEDDDNDDQSEGEAEQRAGFWDEHGNWYSWAEVQVRMRR